MLLKIMQVLIMLRFSTFFNLKPQLKDTESASKSKLIELLTQLKGFKIVATSILVFKQIESEDNFLLNLKMRNNNQWNWHW